MLRVGQTGLPSLHEALDDYSRKHHLPPRLVSDVQLALEEHLTNILSHGYDPNNPGPVTVRFQLEEDDLRVEVEDQGPPFNPLEHPAVDVNRPIEERPLGGLGIHLMRQLVEELEYRREGTSNVLTLRKRMHPQGEPGQSA